jgi:hypothetical protein
MSTGDTMRTTFFPPWASGRRWCASGMRVILWDEGGEEGRKKDAP